jgi:tripartite-type tricarboxylate transporter receptor subunit TctC
MFRFFAPVLSLWLSFTVLLATPGTWAQGTYPSKPIRFIVDSVPGGTTDLMTRLCADVLTKQGIVVSVETKAGATGGLATEYVMNSPADGYTILGAPNGNLLIQHFLEKGASFNPSRDLSSIFISSESQHLLVVPKILGVSDVAGLIAYAKANPDSVNYGSAGLGTQPHISVSQLGKIANMKFTHVPYKGLGGAMTDLLAGRLQLLSSSLGTVKGYLKSGQLKAIAVSGPHRMVALPDVPTAAEAGIPDWSMNVWFGLFGPKNMNPQAQKFLSERLLGAFQDPKLISRIEEQGGGVVSDTPVQINDRLVKEFKVYTQLFKEGVITLE